MKRRQAIVAILGIFVVAITVLAVNAVSGRQSLSSSRRTRARALEAQAEAIMSRLPDTYKKDTRQLTTQLWSTKSADDIVRLAKQRALSFGLSWLNVDTKTSTRLTTEANAGLAITGPSGPPVISVLTAVVSVQGEFHQVTRYLEFLQNYGPLFVLSPVEFSFATTSAVATFTISAIHLVGIEAGRPIRADGTIATGKLPMPSPTTQPEATTTPTTVIAKEPN